MLYENLPLTKEQVSYLLFATDQIAWIIEEEIISPTKKLKLAESERKTYVIYVCEIGQDDVFLSENEDLFLSKTIFQEKLFQERDSIFPIP